MNLGENFNKFQNLCKKALAYLFLSFLQMI